MTRYDWYGLAALVACLIAAFAIPRECYPC